MNNCTETECAFSSLYPLRYPAGVHFTTGGSMRPKKPDEQLEEISQRPSDDEESHDPEVRERDSLLHRITRSGNIAFTCVAILLVAGPLLAYAMGFTRSGAQILLFAFAGSAMIVALYFRKQVTKREMDAVRDSRE